MGRENYTSLEQFVYQMRPGQIPSHIPWYIGQLDANMQTAAGALVNEGVPGMDSKTATGAELMNQASNQHNAPEYALKGDADVRSMSKGLNWRRRLRRTATALVGQARPTRWRLAERGGFCQWSGAMGSRPRFVAACHAL